MDWLAFTSGRPPPGSKHGALTVRRRHNVQSMGLNEGSFLSVSTYTDNPNFAEGAKYEVRTVPNRTLRLPPSVNRARTRARATGTVGNHASILAPPCQPNPASMGRGFGTSSPLEAWVPTRGPWTSRV